MLENIHNFTLKNFDCLGVWTLYLKVHRNQATGVQDNEITVKPV